MAGEVLFFSSFLHSGLKTPTLALLSRLYVILSKQREKRLRTLLTGRLQSSWLMLWPWRGHWPLLRSHWHLQSLSVCNNTSHDAPSFTIYLHWPRFQRKATHTGTMALSLLFIERCLKLRRILGYVSPDKERREGKEKKKKTIKINTAVLHSFTDKQQLHKIGKKYYLCDRKTIRHR